LIGNLLSQKIKDKETKDAFVLEVQFFLHDIFGNTTRIYYGTGHEMAFVMFLSSLFMVGALDREKDRLEYNNLYPVSGPILATFK
jgi:hypothetical protein